jgi:sugar phosphate isomerase/epimerase
MASSEKTQHLSVSLYCFSKEVHAGIYSIPDCIAKVSEIGAEGVEIVNTQHIPGFPEPSLEFIRSFRDTVEKYGLKLSSYGTYTDTGIRTKGKLTLAEMANRLLLDLKLAFQMGFPLIRLGPNTPLPVLMQVLPQAEKLKTKLAIEIHAPLAVEHPVFTTMLAHVRQAASPFIGFCPDFSCWASTIPDILIDQYIRKGFPENALRMIVHSFNAGVSLQAVKEQAYEAGATKEIDDLVDLAYHIVVRGSPESLKNIMDTVLHIHAKFWQIDANGLEPAIPYQELMSIIKRSGYTGFISSEYEGYLASDENDGFEKAFAHQQMMRRFLGMAPI